MVDMYPFTFALKTCHALFDAGRANDCDATRLFIKHLGNTITNHQINEGFKAYLAEGVEGERWLVFPDGSKYDLFERGEILDKFVVGEGQRDSNSTSPKLSPES